MKLFIACIAAFIALTGCSAVVYGPHDRDTNHPTGNIIALQDMLPTGSSEHPTSIRLVFIHGVGDTFPGYALDEKDGWINDYTAAKIGLTHDAKKDSLDPLVHKINKINACLFRNNAENDCKSKYDEQSFVQYKIKYYNLATRCASSSPEPCDRSIPVQAIEITWSALTQWLKTNRLYFDSPSTSYCPDGKTSDSCVRAPELSQNGSTPFVAYPPDRVYINRNIKEHVLDRSLADAIIYAGTYGPVIERGVAQALCHVVAKPKDDDPEWNYKFCIWPQPEATPPTYLFVTHSLGSRILYDLFLNLNDVPTAARPNPFAPKDVIGTQDVTGAKPFVTQMLIKTPAIYMMANQLSLIGLANISPDLLSTDQPGPAFTDDALTRSVSDKHPNDLAVIAKIRADAIRADAIRADAIRADARSTAKEPKEALNIIAFNDTNDLLTWQLPPWYAANGNEQSPDVKMVNVFGRNAARWFWMFEWPQSAHSDYFTKSYVWDLIRCGAKDGVPVIDLLHWKC
jgi:hypothetical protein